MSAGCPNESTMKKGRIVGSFVITILLFSLACWLLSANISNQLCYSFTPCSPSPRSFPGCYSFPPCSQRSLPSCYSFSPCSQRSFPGCYSFSPCSPLSLPGSCSRRREKSDVGKKATEGKCEWKCPLSEHRKLVIKRLQRSPQ